MSEYIAIMLVCLIMDFVYVRPVWARDYGGLLRSYAGLPRTRK